jgi:hypothetical protein
LLPKCTVTQHPAPTGPGRVEVFPAGGRAVKQRGNRRPLS